jgi:hypothetical protein
MDDLLAFPTSNRERHLFSVVISLAGCIGSFSDISSLILSVLAALAYIHVRILLIDNLLLKNDAVYARFQQCAYGCSLALQQTQAI